MERLRMDRSPVLVGDGDDRERVWPGGDHRPPGHARHLCRDPSVRVTRVLRMR